MPHDKNGQVLGDGDLVIIRGRVRSISTGEEYCNVTVDTVEPMYPGEHTTAVTLNAKQVELVEKAAPVTSAQGDGDSGAVAAAADQEKDAGGE